MRSLQKQPSRTVINDLNPRNFNSHKMSACSKSLGKSRSRIKEGFSQPKLLEFKILDSIEKEVGRKL
jgi:hypothetical protein